jgi:ferredoxin-NADP reductase
MTIIEHSQHVETVKHKTTAVTLVASEFEADVRVETKRRVADGVVELRLRKEGDHALPSWAPGAHIDLILDEAPTRQYSLCGDPTDHRVWRVGILRDPDGRGGSLYAHDRLEAGDTVRVRGPRNNFPLVASPRYLFIAGGIGVTPILTMIAAADAAGADWRLVYGGRHRASMAFLDELAGHNDRVSVCPQDETGLLDLDTLLAAPQPDTLVANGTDDVRRLRSRARVKRSHPHRAPRPVHPLRRRRGRGRLAVLLRRRNVRQLRNPCPRRRTGPPRLRPHRGRTPSKRLHDDLRLPLT